MSSKNTSGTILIREKTVLPTGLVLKGEPFLPGWKIVRDIDVYGLGRRIEEAHWNFFYLAGEKKAVVFGHEKSGSLRRAIKQILAMREGHRCNAMEITSVASKSFLGIPFLTVTANYRHVQKSLYLVGGSHADAAISVAITPRNQMDREEPQYHVEVHTTEHPAQV